MERRVEFNRLPLLGPGEIEVRFYGNAAVIRYPADLKIKVRALPNAPAGRFWHTDVYEKRDGRWQVAWSQATQIQQPWLSRPLRRRPACDN